MTGREQLNAVLHKRPRDRVDLTALVDRVLIPGTPVEDRLPHLLSQTVVPVSLQASLAEASMTTDTG